MDASTSSYRYLTTKTINDIIENNMVFFKKKNNYFKVYMQLILTTGKIFIVLSTLNLGSSMHMMILNVYRLMPKKFRI
jgi:hypothetical protein